MTGVMSSSIRVFVAVSLLGCVLGEATAEEGSNGSHWAYRAPVRVSVPPTRSGDEIGNGVDAFVVRRLRERGLEPLGLADRETLIRRVTLDLLGVPPTLAEIDAFLADRRGGRGTAWSTACWPRRGTANAGRCRGWMPRAMPTATDTSETVAARRGAGATG